MPSCVGDGALGVVCVGVGVGVGIPAVEIGFVTIARIDDEDNVGSVPSQKRR